MPQQKHHRHHHPKDIRHDRVTAPPSDHHHHHQSVAVLAQGVCVKRRPFLVLQACFGSQSSGTVGEQEVVGTSLDFRASEDEASGRWISVVVMWVLTALIICKIVKKITIIMIIIATIMIIIAT